MPRCHSSSSSREARSSNDLEPCLGLQYVALSALLRVYIREQQPKLLFRQDIKERFLRKFYNADFLHFLLALLLIIQVFHLPLVVTWAERRRGLVSQRQEIVDHFTCLRKAQQ